MERYRPPRGDLFHRGDIHQLEEALKETIRKRIHDLEDDYILNVSEQEYIDYLAEEFHLDCPLILYDEKSIEPRNVLVSPEYLPRSWFYYDERDIERKMYRLHIPFQGDSELLRFRPNPFSLSAWSNFTISYDSVYVDILDINEDANEVKRECDSYVNTLREMMNSLEKNYSSINKIMPDHIRSMFTIRKKQIQKEHKELVDIGIPIKGQMQQNTYTVPTVQRRFKPVPGPTKTIIEPPTPTMADKEYQDILSALNTIGRNLERFPNTHKGKDEESIRDLFLVQLATSFTAYTSTGEAFNHKGKTDLMVKNGDDILFIAECKFWKGARVFIDAISQLLGYLTWRDTKTALLVFNRDVGMTTALQSIENASSKHPNYLSGKKNGDARFDCVFHLNEDKNQQVKMAIFVFDFHET
ncbi:MAG: hypothetical protein IJV44_11885 [Prevotella sp.]|nr:hypothetical protein [Prevotella sp.]